MSDLPSVAGAPPSSLVELQTVFNATGTMIVTTDADGIVRSFNPAAERLLGWRADEVVGKQSPVIWHVPEEVAARAAELSRKLGRTVQPGQDFFQTSCLESNGQPSDWTLIRKDGSTFPVQLSVVAMRDSTGRITGYVGTALDSTDRVRAERELDRFFDLSLDLLCIANTDGYFKRINLAFCRTLGWSEAEILARPFIDFVHPNDRPATLREVEKSSRGQPTLHFENRYQCKDGSWRWLSWKGMPQPGGFMFGTARDVTDERQFEHELRRLNTDLERRVGERTAELRQSQEHLRLLLQNVPAGVAMFDRQMRYLAVSPQFLADFHIQWPDVIGKSHYELFPEIPERWKEIHQRCLAGAVEKCDEDPFPRADGTIDWVCWEIHPWRNDAGEVGGIILLSEIVNERKQLYDKLAAGERFNRATLNALSAHIAVLDAEGNIVAVNQAWTEFSQATSGSCQMVSEGTNYLTICDRSAANGDSDAAAAAQAIREVIAGKLENWFHEYPCHSPTEQCWFYCRVARYIVDGQTRAVVAHENITEQKKAQEALAATHAMYESLARVSPVAIILSNAKGECIDANQRWCEMAGMSAADAVGEGWKAAINPEDLDRVSQAWSQAIREGQPFRCEFRLRRPNGDIAWVISQGVPIRDAEGEITGFVRVSTDLTDQKQTEQTLRFLSTDLAMLSGPAFYEAVVRQLSELLNCEFAFICRRDASRPDELFVTAMFADGDFQPPFSYPIAGTPCEHVVDHQSCVVPRGVQQQYPEDLFLVEKQIEAYVGVPFIDSRGIQIGHMGVMSRRPLNNPENVESVTKLFAVSVTAEMEREVNERRFADLFEFSPDAIVITDRDGLIVQANRQIAKVFGWTPAELVGQPVEVLMPAALRAGHPALREQYLQSALPRAMGSGRNDLLGLRKDGSVFPVDISLSPMQTPEGLLVAAAVRDVTERQKVLHDLEAAGAKLRESEQRFRLMVNGVKDYAILMLDPEGRVASWNDGAKQITGYGADEIIGQHFSRFYPEEAVRVGFPQHELDIAKKEGRCEDTGWRVRKDGSQFWANAVITAIHDDAHVLRGFSKITRDITEHMQAEEALHEAQRISHLGSWNWDIATNDEIWSDEQFRIFGFEPQSFGPTYSTFLDSLHPDDRTRVLEAVDLALKGIQPYEVECRIQRPSGETRQVVCRGEVQRSPENKPVRMIGTVLDITAAKQAEEALRQSEHRYRTLATELEHRVAERTAELTTANEELVRASQFKSEFLATMSHELRTPLNGVLGMNELLLKTALSDKQREFVEASSTAGRSLLGLITDVLDLSKIEAGKIELDMHSCELEALAYDVITMFTHRAKQKGITLACRLDPDSCLTVMCDDNRLRQILVNLLGNALKFTANGSVMLESRCLRKDEQQCVVRLSVTDTGLGIPDAKLSRLFSPFSQVDSSTTRQYGGTGLGLSIAKQLTELMGGTIGVTSRLGVGSTFWIEVPFELVNQDIKTTQRRQLLGGTRVLAVDGVDRERRQIADCLEAWGCPFKHVGTLREAVEAVARAEQSGQPFAVILADCRLAIGDEFVHLQSLARNPKVPVIGLGIGEGNDLAGHLRQLGLRHLLRDPVRPSALFNALASVLAVTPPPVLSSQPRDSQTTENQEPKFSGHVLVAEDNLINQMFVRELLKHCGCTCDVANNGDEALTAVAQKRYDLVLMDSQMPEMDGFTAAREIRRRETVGELSGRLPIIALTANALKGDRERCLAAGMDDYLSKPLQAAQLQAMLAKYLGQSEEGSSASNEVE